MIDTAVRKYRLKADRASACRKRPAYDMILVASYPVISGFFPMRRTARRYYNYRREEKPDGSDVALPVPKVFYKKFTPKSNLFSKPSALNRGEVVFPPVPPL